MEKDLIIKFPEQKLLDDLDYFRKDIREMVEFKNKIKDGIKDEDLIEDVEDEDGNLVGKTINNNIVNCIINLNDSISESFKALSDTYHKMAKNIEVVEKAYKYNKETNPKSTTDEDEQQEIENRPPEEILNDGNNLFNIKEKKTTE